jgi:hypothetical protein
MANRTATLEVLRTDIENQADFVGATQRYTDAVTTRWINQSIQRFRERISLEGSTHYLVSVTKSLTSGATSPYPFQVLDLSAESPSLVRTFGVDITLPGGIIRTLSHTPFTERCSYGGPSVTGIPVAWAHYQTRKIAILPPPNQTLTAVVWYLPVVTDLSADGDTFDGVSGWEDFIVWDVVVRHMTRDRDSDGYQMATAYRAETWSDIVRNATKVTSAGGAHIGRDSMGARGGGGYYARKGRLPPP